jgi:hypothetical protein
MSSISDWDMASFSDFHYGRVPGNFQQAKILTLVADWHTMTFVSGAATGRLFTRNGNKNGA